VLLSCPFGRDGWLVNDSNPSFHVQIVHGEIRLIVAASGIPATADYERLGRSSYLVDSYKSLNLMRFFLAALLLKNQQPQG
jgi:hypothetical protein